MTSQSHIFSVQELTQRIKTTLEGSFGSILLKGELSNVKIQSSGHAYFSLKDTAATISCVMFRGDFSRVRAPIKDGDTVLVRGELTVYPPRGNYQLVCHELSLHGLGELLLQLEQLKQKLAAQGYFDPKRKRPIPRFPKRIGVVTSPTGAVIEDIINILSRRLHSFHLLLNPVKVQGEGAAEEIAAAIHDFNAHALVDVIIVGRGGGSFEDLLPFNSEKVADAIFKSKIPIISAVGHETDVSISDFVADLRAPTPSGAAELVSVSSQEVTQKLMAFQSICDKLIRRQLHIAAEKIKQLKKQPCLISPMLLLSHAIQKTDSIREKLDRAIAAEMRVAKEKLLKYKKTIELIRPDRKIQLAKEQLLAYTRALNMHITRVIFERRQLLLRTNVLDRCYKLLCRKYNDCKTRMANAAHILQALNPRDILRKGYAIPFIGKERTLVHSVRQLEQKQELRLIFADGEATTQVMEIYDTRGNHI